MTSRSRVSVGLASALLLAGCEKSTAAALVAPGTTGSAAPVTISLPPASAPEPPAAASVAAPATSAERDCIPRRPERDETAPGKQRTAEQLLMGQSINLYLDARRAGVVVPEYLAKDGKLMLQVGYAMAVPIPDLKVDSKGVSGTLSFKRKPFFVKVPWSAVFAAVGVEDKRGWVWQEDVPEDVRCP